MKNYSQLKEECDNKVKALQTKCNHKNLSEWLKECWAIGHITGKEVKICENCRKAVKRRKAVEDEKLRGFYMK